MKKSIFTVFIPVESQEQSDRLKQICIDNGLEYGKEVLDFMPSKDLFFRYSDIFQEFQLWLYNDKYAQSTEAEFIELLKEYKK